MRTVCPTYLRTRRLLLRRWKPSDFPPFAKMNAEPRVMEYNKICKYRVSQMAYFLEKMKNTMDGDASLLDKTMVIWGSPMADSNLHSHRRCPLVLFGHADGQLKGGVHLKADDREPGRVGGP